MVSNPTWIVRGWADQAERTAALVITMKVPVPALGGTTPTEAFSSFVVSRCKRDMDYSRENGNPGGPTKDRVTQTRRMRTIPTCHSTNLSLRRSLPPRRRGAAIQRASVGDRLSLSPGCTPDRTLPADATGLDSGLRRNDMGRGHMGTNHVGEAT